MDCPIKLSCAAASAELRLALEPAFFGTGEPFSTSVLLCSRLLGNRRTAEGRMITGSEGADGGGGTISPYCFRTIQVRFPYRFSTIPVLVVPFPYWFCSVSVLFRCDYSIELIVW